MCVVLLKILFLLYILVSTRLASRLVKVHTREYSNVALYAQFIIILYSRFILFFYVTWCAAASSPVRYEYMYVAEVSFFLNINFWFQYVKTLVTTIQYVIFFEDAKSFVRKQNQGKKKLFFGNITPRPIQRLRFP